MYSNKEQNKWHKIQQMEEMEFTNDGNVPPYAIPSLIIALSSLIVSGILIF